jgi:hypothetical protein
LPIGHIPITSSTLNHLRYLSIEFDLAAMEGEGRGEM